MNVTEFWREVKLRRDRFFLWGIGWLFAGAAIAACYQLLFKQEAPAPLMVVVMLVWVLIWNQIQRRLTELLCPRCGLQAFRHPYFFMRHARCQHCGFKHSA